MIFAGVSVAVNVALALTLFPVIAEAGIATAESASGWLNAVAAPLHAAPARPFHLRRGASCAALPRLILCCAVMGAVALSRACRLLGALFPARGGHSSQQVGALLLLMGGGALVYFAAAQLTGAADLRELLRNLAAAGARPPA